MTEATANSVTPENTDDLKMDSIEDLVSDVMQQLDAAGFTIEHYHQLVETILLSLSIDYEDQITEDSPKEEIMFLMAMAARYCAARDIIAIDVDDDEYDDEEEEEEEEEDEDEEEEED